ncbi:MAG: DUF2156 domain-containing protein [Clostridia bacterium]|nr:DUF2156 domain-containing protein [Clostridia bacterium]
MEINKVLEKNKPSPPEFTRISLPQMERVEAIRAASGSVLHVHTFASLYAWQECEGYEICIADGAFLVKYGARGENAYLFPCGDGAGKKALIDALLQSGTPTFHYVSDDDKLFLENAYPGRCVFTACRDDYPYLYDKEEQIALAGKEFKSLRHQVNLGRLSARSWSSEPLTAENAERALRINRKWADSRADGDLADTAAAETALRELSQLGIWGVIFQADGEDVAYVAGTFITPEIYDVCFCKVLEKQCDCFIKRELYRVLPETVRTVDSEEDMGIAGLRTHKLLRRPKELVRVWKGEMK